MPSYDRINFTVRPAKHVERKMLAEAIGKLTHLQRLDAYRYVGFGSIYFTDFTLLHKTTGIRKMISIESEVAEAARFEFNRPFRCIKLRFGRASDVLPLLPWSEPTILWLDYDDRLDVEKLDDITFFCANAAPDSMLIVTVNANPSKGFVPFTLTDLRNDVLPKRVSAELTNEALRDWGTATVSAAIAFEEIDKAMLARNGAGGPAQFRFRDLFNFQYRDSARMLTVGGLLYRSENEARVDRCRFSDLRFIRSRAKAFRIPVPKLTFREVRYLDSRLPAAIPDKSLAKRGIPKDDVLQYAEVYRYFPTYADAEI